MKIEYFLIRFCIIYCLLCSVVLARELTYIDAFLNPAKLQGSGELTWWGLHVYDASLYRGSNPNSAEFALDLRYYKSFRASSIIDRSIEEMKKFGITDAQAQNWGRQLTSILPDIESGQNLTAIYSPKQGTSFYFEGKPIGRISGVEFPKAFFGIWLDPRTSAPKLREKLLGQGCPPSLFQEACN